MGAAQLVVQDALERIVSVPSMMSSFTPSTTVLMPGSFAGAESNTFFAPAVKCKVANSRVRKWQVH